jgi:5-(carboxyamino)imidazole ribonucleotide synthase
MKTTPLPPGSTIGILGGGQLGRMLAMAAARLGLKCAIYSDHRGPAFDVAAAATVGAFDDLEAIRAFARTVDVMTYEFENVPVASALAAQAIVPVRPGPKALEVAQDRLVEKTFLADLGIPVAPFHQIDCINCLRRAIGAINGPAILKTRRLGYDGKGQASVKPGDDLEAALKAIGNAPAVLEKRLAFEYEVSDVSVWARAGAGWSGESYDLPRNEHRDGILHRSNVPSGLAPATAEKANALAARLASALEYEGVLAVEMFYLGETAEMPLVVNEFAPRVHNSGHWTIDACAVSQFENHIRAVAGWPLGSTARHSDAVMTNLVGADYDDWPKIAARSGSDPVCLHLYGKHEARPGRKMGHVTWLKPRSGA